MPPFVGHPHPYHTMSTVRRDSFRRLPLSPPETDHDAPHVPSVPLSVHPSADFDVTSSAGHYLGATPEHARFQSRRTSTLSYQNSGARDFHDRSHSRNPKNLVVVIPPPDLPLPQGQLGNVLSMGPRHRLPQGILMPLLPSMFGQLNAIAREYNFPSTVGLCLYLHINENGIAMTPRISDDSWQHLFGHLFEARPSSWGQRQSIGGNIEFDIDLNKARWFDAWVSGTLQDSDPFLPVVTSQASLGAHWRGESQAMNVDEQPAEDRWDASGTHTLVTNSRSGTLRHLPKKLSLVDRLESHHALPKLQNHFDRLDSLQTHSTEALSPAPESTIPQVVKSDLESRVNSWRATTELYPASMTETYQPAPDVGISVGMTTMDEYALERNFRPAVNVDEYLWSVTPAGPCSPVMKTPIASSRPSSVRLDCRANGTIPRTPITMTTWGPTDDKWHLVVSAVSRFPSPDTGERMIEGAMVPRIRAVWGNSFGWRSAMTWKKVYPYSVIQTMPMVRVQLQDPNGLVPRYPNLVLYPTVGSHPDTLPPDVFAHSKFSTHSVWGSSFGWQRVATWKMVYPYSEVTMESIAPIQLCGVGGLESKYPNLHIYRAIYPYFEIYPACAFEEDTPRPASVTVTTNESNSLTMCYPTLAIYPAMYPHFDIYPTVSKGVKIKGSDPLDTSIYSLNGASTLYPNLVIYPAVYPHLDLYPKTLQINQMLKQKEVVVKLANSGSLAAEYPNMTIYPSYLNTHPTQDTRMRTSGAAWSISFGWLTAKTWLQVYPLHTVTPLITQQAVNDASRPISGSCSQNSTAVDFVAGKQAIWGNSFGWKNSTTWRAVWPTPSARMHPDISIRLEQQSGSSSNYPHMIIYPATYSNLDIYPPRAAITEATGSQTTNDQCSINLIPRYPNLVIYPAVYPYIDVYQPFAEDLISVTRGKGQSNLRRRRMEIWRARTAAQVELAKLLANGHIWEADEPLQIGLADYAWSQTSAGPSTSSVELPPTPSILGSVHIDRRIQGSVLLTPSTATTWGPQDDDWHSDIISIDRLPSPDLGQRVLDDAESTGFTHQPLHLLSPFFGNASQLKGLPSILEKSIFVPEYPHLVIYPPAYPHFELYPAWANVSTSKIQVVETLANSDRFPVLNIYPAIYPYFNIYPAIDSQVQVSSGTVPDVQHESVGVKPPSPYPKLDICYPYNLNSIYPFVNAVETPTEASYVYPWLVVYPPLYPFIIPYPAFSAEVSQPLKPQQPPILSPRRKLVSVKLSVQYPTLDIYSASYPWSLESIYPAVSVDDFPGVVKPQYPCIQIYPAVYPFVEPYPDSSDSTHIPGVLDEDKYASVKAFLALPELMHIDSESVLYPYFDLYPAPLTLPHQQERIVQDKDVQAIPPLRTLTVRKTHMELHAAVFRCLEKRPARILKTHLQLHTEVFQDNIVWTPSGYVQDLSSPTTKKREAAPVQESQRRSSKNNSTSRQPRSPSRTLAVQSPDKLVFPLGQSPTLPAIPPLRVRSPVIPSQPSPAVSETPMPRVSSPTNAFTHKRTTSSRLTQAVKSMMPGTQRRNSSATPASPFQEPPKEHVKDQPPPARTRLISLVDRRQAVVPPLPHTNTSEFLVRAPQSSQRKESLVLQRARAYEQVTVNLSSTTVGTNVTHASFTLPPLPPMPSMTDVVETIEKSKLAFP